MYSYDKPASLEEAFDIVRGQVPQKMKSVLNDPFGSFVANLAKAVKESKQTYVPKKEPEYVQPEVFEEELIEEEELTQEEEEIYLAEALNELEIALQRARDEVCERQQLLAEQEAEQKIKEEQLVAEEKLLLSRSLSNLEEAFQKARNEISTRQQTNETEVPVSVEEDTPILTETIKEDSKPIAEKSYIPVAKNQEDNPYLKELVRSSQFDDKKVKGSRKKSELKKLIAEQIAAELNAFKQQLYSSNLMMGGGGGGGTNAVQYAAGGTMRGDLNVTGKILSGGIDLSEAIRQSVSTAVLGLTSLNITATLPDPFVVDDGSF